MRNTIGLPFHAMILAAALLLTSTHASAQSSSQPARAAIIPIQGAIDEITRQSIERRMQEAHDAGANTIIFELDTPGGLVISALGICRTIKNAPQGTRTIAWVNPEAYSAGAMISVACDEIWMGKSSSIGDCAPIMIVPGAGPQELGETERAKAESPILQEFRDSAIRNGYNQLLSRAMVAMPEEVWWIERTDESGERRFVRTNEKSSLIDDTEEDQREWKLVASYIDSQTGKSVDVDQPIVSAKVLLTMSQQEAIAFGFARGIVHDQAELLTKLGIAAPPMVLKMNGWETFASWLNSPFVRGIFLVLVLLGAYIEFQTPGVGVAGGTALIALIIFLAAPYAAGLAWAWPLVLLVLGMILLGVELFLLPGFGVAGILGVLAMVVAIVASFIPVASDLPAFSLPDISIVGDGIVTGLKVFVSSLAIAIAGMLLLAHLLPKSPLAVGVITGNPDAEDLALDETFETVAQIGAVGVVTGDLRPGGQARFGAEIVDVHSQGEYVEVGQRVQIISREGMHIVVRPLSDEGTA